MSHLKMTKQRFENIVSSYGSNEQLWPEEERALMLGFLAESADAQSFLKQEQTLDNLLNTQPSPMPASAEFLDKLSLMPPPKTINKPSWGLTGFNKFIPSLNLSGYLPRAVGLASICALGIMLGLSNVARYNQVGTSVDASSLLFNNSTINKDIEELD